VTAQSGKDRREKPLLKVESIPR